MLTVLLHGVRISPHHLFGFQNLNSLCLESYLEIHCYAAEAIVLGFQHYLLTLGITVLIPNTIVPQMGGGDVRIYA
ncbi:hypothetical protein PSY81_23445, partial [Shigella flexneri]|nr:hypothetical protein [Shigella flexneri]